LSLQKVRRGGWTSLLHQRHRACPFGPRGSFLGLAQPPGRWREVLIASGRISHCGRQRLQGFSSMKLESKLARSLDERQK
jgi:hypothetical protein